MLCLPRKTEGPGPRLQHRAKITRVPGDLRPLLAVAVGPKAVTVMGGKYVMKDNREIPDTLEALWEFDGP